MEYQEISHDQRNDILHGGVYNARYEMNNLEIFTEYEMDQLNNYLSNLKKSSRIIRYKFITPEDDKFYFLEIEFELRWTNEFIFIFKAKDEWFYTSFALGLKQICYKCDQIDGLIDYLDTLFFINLNKTFENYKSD